MKHDDFSALERFATRLFVISLAFMLGVFSGRWSTGVDRRLCIDGRLYVQESANLLVANGQHCARLPLGEQM